MNIDKLFLNNDLYNNIIELLKQGNLPHALLFLSTDEYTNIEFSKAVAIKIACNSSSDVIKALSNTHPDILVYPASKQNISTLDMADIYDKIQVKPILSKYKVIILNNFDCATEQAQNKILKILEEPPKNVFLILNGTNENKIIATILSRVQKRYIPKASEQDALSAISDILQNNNELSNSPNELNNQIKHAYDLSNGYIGDILNIISNAEYRNNDDFVIKFIENCKNSSQIIEYINFINKDNINPILQLFSKHYAYLLENIVNGTVVSDYSINALINIIKHLDACKKMLDSNVSISALSEFLLLKIMEIKNLCK